MSPQHLLPSNSAKPLGGTRRAQEFPEERRWTSVQMAYGILRAAECTSVLFSKVRTNKAAFLTHLDLIDSFVYFLAMDTNENPAPELRHRL